MSEEERIKALEKEVADLKQLLSKKRIANPWSELSNKINDRVKKAFGNDDSWSPQSAQVKSAISCLIGKAYCKNSVTALTKEQVDEAEIFADYILCFIEEKRKEHAIKNPICGYERPVQGVEG